MQLTQLREHYTDCEKWREKKGGSPVKFSGCLIFFPPKSLSADKIIRESCTYEGHSEITDTPLAFRPLDETKNFAVSKGKREDWKCLEKEKVVRLCSSTETGAVQGWAMVESRCQLHSFNQAINDCIIT